MANEQGAEFEMGARYENRKGPFEVVRIEGDNMLIRWDDGQEVETTIGDQVRIKRNMERELQGPTPKGKRASKCPAWFGESFVGLKETDFKDDVTGSHWRSREQLGGAVAKALVGADPFISWATYKRPQVHWSTLMRSKAAHSIHRTKFFARVWQEDILIGLYLERPNVMNDPQQDWQHFIQWLKHEQNEDWFRGMLEEQGAILENPYFKSDNSLIEGKFVPAKNGFVYSVNGEDQPIPTGKLGMILGDLPSDRTINLVIGKRITKQECVAQGLGLANTMADFFNALMPVFECQEISGKT